MKFNEETQLKNESENTQKYDAGQNAKKNGGVSKAGVAAGVAAGVIAGAGGAYAAGHVNTHDKAAEKTDPKHDDNAKHDASAKHDDGAQHDADVKHDTGAQQEPHIQQGAASSDHVQEPQPTFSTGSASGDNGEVHVIATNTIEGDDGNMVTVAHVEYGGNEAYVADVNNDGNIDVFAADTDHNGEIDVMAIDNNQNQQFEEDEIHDVSGQGIQASNLYAAAHGSNMNSGATDPHYQEAVIHNPGTYDDDATGAHEAFSMTEGGTTDASDAVITHDGGYDHAAIDTGGMNDYTSDADTNGMMDI